MPGNWNFRLPDQMSNIADIVRSIDEVNENTFKYMNILNNNFKKCLKLNTVNISDFLDLYENMTSENT